MATTMRALRKMQAARGLSLETAAVPAIGPADVLVRVKAASICAVASIQILHPALNDDSFPLLWNWFVSGSL